MPRETLTALAERALAAEANWMYQFLDPEGGAEDDRLKAIRDALVSALLARLAEAEEALQFIRDNKHCDYQENCRDSYGKGVTDGHRYCSTVARAALAGLPNPYTAPDFKKAMDAVYESKNFMDARRADGGARARAVLGEGE